MISCNFSAMSLSHCNCSNDSITKYVNQQDCIPYEKSALTTLFFINQHEISSLTQLWLTFLSAKQFPRSETHLKTTRKSMCIFCVRGTRTQLLISVLCPVQLIGEISGDFICVDTYLPRFEALAYVSNWRKWWFVVMRSCLRKALFIIFLFVFALKGFFIFFFVGAAFATFFLARELVFDGIYFVKLDENIGDCPFTSGFFTVFLVVNSIHFKKIRYVDIMSTIAEKCVLHTVLFLWA